jgi:hypothetical protein
MKIVTREIFAQFFQSMIENALNIVYNSAVAQDLQKPWREFGFSRIDRQPSAMPFTGPLIRSIAPWNDLRQNIWDAIAASSAHRLRPLARSIREIKPFYHGSLPAELVCPPQTWDDLEVKLKRNLFAKVYEFDRKIAAKIFFQEPSKAIAAFEDVAFPRFGRDLAEFNPKSIESVRTHSLRLIDTATIAPPNLRPLRLALGLLLLGYVIERTVETPFCRLCFRRPIPGMTYCEMHTQTAGDISALARYHHGRRVQNFLRLNGGIPNLFVDEKRDYMDNWRLTRDNIESAAPTDEVQLAREIIGALQSAPAVTNQLIQENIPCDYENLIKLLHDKLDRRETLHRLWPDKIRYAQSLLASSEEIATTRRGNGVTTDRRKILVSELAKTKRNAEIARELDVTERTVRNLRKKAADLD